MLFERTKEVCTVWCCLFLGHLEFLLAQDVQANLVLVHHVQKLVVFHFLFSAVVAREQHDCLGDAGSEWVASCVTDGAESVGVLAIFEFQAAQGTNHFTDSTELLAMDGVHGSFVVDSAASESNKAVSVSLHPFKNRLE